MGETDELINKKIKAVLEIGLKPILCVGENEGENRIEVLEKQLTGGLDGVLDGISDLVIAYEPVWAISSGDPYATKKMPTAKEIQEASQCIKGILAKKSIENIRIIYGGSTNAENAKQYLEIMDGLLVGGASLKAEEFVKIVDSATI
mgnify:CR=1 FL=1